MKTIIAVEKRIVTELGPGEVKIGDQIIGKFDKAELSRGGEIIHFEVEISE